MAGQGVGDYLLKQYQAAMPMFDHVIIFANTGRYARVLKSKNVCTPVAWLTNQEKHLLHSRPHSLEPPIGILMHKGVVIPLNQKRPLSLNALMQGTNFRLVALKPFQYPEQILDILDEYEELGRVLYLNDHTIEINEMLLERGRADVALAMPSQMTELLLRGRGSDFHFHQIQELKSYIQLMSHCSDDPVGQEALRIISSILTDDFLEYILVRYKSWYPEIDDFETLFRKSISFGRSAPPRQ